MAKKSRKAEEPFKPKGTLVVILLFFIALVALWFSVYAILLSRGVTV